MSKKEKKTHEGMPDYGLAVAGAMWLLGNANRMSMVYAMFKHGPLSVSQLARIAGVSQSLVSQSMGLMQETGMVLRDRQGHSVYYDLNRENRFVGHVVTPALEMVRNSEK